MNIVLIEEVEKVLARHRARKVLSDRQCLQATAEHFCLPVEAIERIDAGTMEVEEEA